MPVNNDTKFYQQRPNFAPAFSHSHSNANLHIHSGKYSPYYHNHPDSRDMVIAADQRHAHEMDAADGKLDGAYYGKPVGVAGQRCWLVVEKCTCIAIPFTAYMPQPVVRPAGLKSPLNTRPKSFLLSSDWWASPRYSRSGVDRGRKREEVLPGKALVPNSKSSIRSSKFQRINTKIER